MRSGAERKKGINSNKNQSRRAGKGLSLIKGEDLRQSARGGGAFRKSWGYRKRKKKGDRRRKEKVI